MNINFKNLILALGFSSAIGSTCNAANIEQTVQFDDLAPEVVYNAFVNSKDHSAVLKSPVTIGAKVGSTYSAFDGKLKGTVIASKDGQQLVMSWRTWKFETTDTDSILVLTFVKNEKGSQIEMVHVNVPDKLRSEVNTHWNTFYWDGWRSYMKSLKK